MFRLLSKESNIFSVPVYIGFLFLIFLLLNLLDFKYIDVFPAIITFMGISLGYFLFNAIALNQFSHLPLFLYTIFVASFYDGTIEVGLAFTFLTSAIILLILTSQNDYLRKSSFMLVGSILAFNYLVFPPSWPMGVFVIFHIIGTSGRISLNIFRLFFGIILIVLSYFGLMYLIHYTTWDKTYLPFYGKFELLDSYFPLYILTPIALMLLYSLSDHFKHYNEKSPISRYKYTFVLVFSLAQLITIIFYMGNNYEYLLLLALPVSIILSRMLRFLPKYWMQELGLWIIVFTLAFFKIAIFFKF
ncbi:DUF6427 family protein [Epilithonimonas pallida]|uniref:Beta-carotene 15,15'-monooxygenase n=1 Tax=Epilithonimonas pallida TaxID=373671 RepID=A0ABY1R3Y1_9FLAO|nr:DUF6427 family protein [Epilithonimonas pallida]SMP92078.1 hypothetical protein SAMN05421679_103458 [Epilithonimonas pallida]